jgi:rhodanese-related sulfurtransferase
MTRALVVIAIAASGCASDVSTREAHRLVAGGARLLDVRTREEFSERHAPHAVNIPVDELQRRLSELGAHERPLVVYCHTGARAGIAVLELRRAGFRRVYNLGSLARWFRESSGAWPLY